MTTVNMLKNVYDWSAVEWLKHRRQYERKQRQEYTSLCDSVMPEKRSTTGITVFYLSNCIPIRQS